MKKPTLRLRQVFEGPTHFKVVKPLGNPIKIAKKGLSPNLMGRLRKFATGAEVTEPVYGTGTTEEQLTQVRSDIEAEAQREEPSVDVLRMLREREQQLVDRQLNTDNVDSKPIVADQQASTARPRPRPQRPVGAPVEVIKASDVAPVEIVKPPSFRQIAKSSPVEQPVGVPVEAINASNVEQYPISASATPVVSKAPRVRGLTTAEILGAPGAPRAERIAPASSLDQINAIIGEEMSKPEPDMDRLARLTAEAERLTAAAPAPVIPAVPAAAAVKAVSAPAALAAAPAAVVTPATPVPTASAVPSAVAPAKLGTAAAATPAAIAAAPAALPAQLTADQLFNKRLGDLGLSRAEYDKMSPLSRMSVQGIVRQAAALEEQSIADEAMVKAEMRAQQDIIDEERLRLNKIEKRADEARQLQKEILEDMNHLKDPQSYFSSTSTIGQIGTAISLAAGAFASGMTGMPNYAMQIYNNAVEKDLELQKMKRDSLFSRLRDAGHSAESAEEMVRASARLIAGAQAGKLASIAKLPKVKASLSLEQAKLVNDAVIGMARAAELEARPGEREQDRELRREEIAARRAAASASAEEKRLSREQREALRQEKIDQEREKRNINVGYDTLELIDKTGGRQVRKELSNRVSALTAAVELDELFKEGGYEIFNVASNKYRGRGLALLPMLIEQYPLGKGFERAISKNAGEFLKEAMAKPQEATSFIKKLFLGRDAGVGVQELRRDFQRSYVNSVSGYVRNPTSPQVKKAIKDQIDIINEQVKAESEAESGGGFTFQTEP